MADLTGTTPADTYKSLLQIGDATNGVDATAKYIEDGEGTNSALAISTTEVGIGTDDPSTTLHAKKGDSSVKFLQDDKAAITLEAGSLADFHISHDGTTNKMYVSHGAVVGNAKLLTINANDGNVGIGTTSPSAPLEVSSTTGGVVMPRMTTTQRNAIASPTNGEMVYDTDLNKFYGYANSAWTALH